MSTGLFYAVVGTLGMAGLAVTCWLALVLRSKQILPYGLASDVEDMLRRGMTSEARDRCRSSRSVLARVWIAALDRAARPGEASRVTLERVVDGECRRQAALVEARAGYLLDVSVGALLAGFVGAVCGAMNFLPAGFDALRATPGALKEALAAAAAAVGMGLGVSVLAMAAYALYRASGAQALEEAFSKRSGDSCHAPNQKPEPSTQHPKTNMSQDWEIKTCGRSCAATGQPFADQQAIFSRLCHTQDGYVREDFSVEGWTDERRKESVSYWKSTFKAPPPPAPEPVKRETAEAMLRQYMEKEDYSRKNAVYILAVMLERKRILVERDVQLRPDGSKFRIYEHKKTGEIFTIPDPGLRLDELESVQKEVNALLGIAPRPTPLPAPGPGSDGALE